MRKRANPTRKRPSFACVLLSAFIPAYLWLISFSVFFLVPTPPKINRITKRTPEVVESTRGGRQPTSLIYS
ncbi:MAG: hypothetical protein JWP63_5094 [Candidatus Solibacter sp.]|jgi:hypothetical protein|nr:hypothetical protein [Candidatus Solibacter sp.]